MRNLKIITYLPPFFDDERQTFEYVYYPNHIFNKNSQKYPEVNPVLTDALADIAYTGLYYSFRDHSKINVNIF